ncbi:LANO_0F14598g1_1 [Lachancea nothofagi CBS 11611]|uniref:Enolase-phosphatase E1 n=1 Tax=Lachancea nothofagi CBS 11611 TaxID=1266666 RepID=A0A1G4KCE9_9SACH|nr:LANO_0F14598g1_1 [Lachancea nothofagi CBS 11611]
MAFSTVLLDIEGTVCPISFVKETLFPYFLQQVDSLTQSREPQVQDLLSQFKVEDVKAHIRDLVARDVKDPILKQLQGVIWQHGYASGQITAPVYADAINFIKSTNKPVYIYSSGSVKAQQLLFQYVRGSDKAIDLRPEIMGYYDINTSGVKTKSESYRNIARDIGCDPNDILFISDNVLELEAAQKAGLKSKLAIRPGNYPVEDLSAYDTISDFAQL